MRNVTLVIFLVASLFVTNCQTTPTQNGAMAGGALGAVAGQLLGGDTESTMIGAGAGALGGALFNDYRTTSQQNAYNKGVSDAQIKGAGTTPQAQLQNANTFVAPRTYRYNKETDSYERN